MYFSTEINVIAIKYREAITDRDEEVTRYFSLMISWKKWEIDFYANRSQNSSK